MDEGGGSQTDSRASQNVTNKMLNTLANTFDKCQLNRRMDDKNDVDTRMNNNEEIF